VGLWDRYGGSVESGWLRWLLEKYECPFERVFAQALDAGDLASRYDVIILPDDAVPSRLSRRQDGTDIAGVPVEYRAATGSMTWDRTLPQLKQFVADGGTLILIGGSTAIGERLGVPVSNALTVPDGSAQRPLRRDEFYVPGSILQVSIDNTQPLAYGLGPRADVFFDNSPVFRLEASDAADGRRGAAVLARRVAWFATPAPLRSGRALGQEHLLRGVAVADVSMGRGHIAMFGPPIAFRGQSHGTFKLLFNAIYYGAASPVVRVPGGAYSQ
jgi:hypothetical protein